ncbi:leucine-rich repeat-containing protein 34-like isoform X1 [Cylas formicarius]|uniref:leucine-rich repeat-containing protein 34-like isoform X1 n=1 Tax=Cylas formicarius TaxID=197179 RepID=UPI002958A06F|nr:leucine-rich repeat-containing protein 34-like isoform X1 [Cylas formicarius]XP_060531956.1 leucine-rich repeat-containing protein 34-like isoform X1 [Cylas formicarius]XP_060531957.1 leucine-rich repeat-containing protein 34-like isoform X1 [Cylas formicarius]
MSKSIKRKKLDDVLFSLYCEKNSDGTRHLRLRGRELFQRIGRRLSEDDMQQLTIFLTKNPEVTSLDLSYNNFGNYGIQILSQNYLNTENNLSYLNLLHCDIGVEGMKWLSSGAFLRFKGIRLLGNKLGVEGARYIGQLIENCPTLEDLDIGETDQTLESIESLLIIIEKNPLKTLNMSRIIPNSYYARCNNSTLADDLGVLLKLNQTLEEIAVQKCEFDGHDLELLVAGLQVHRNLLVLDLGANRIGDHGIEVLITWLKTRPLLNVLRIPSNAVTNIGARALSFFLPFTRIRLLDLQNNKIGDQGISNMLDSIKKPTPLRILYIWGNSVGDYSLQKIERLLNAGVLDQGFIDIKIYYVDGQRKCAHHATDRYKTKLYSTLKYGFSPDPKIKTNKVPEAASRTHALIAANFLDRFPPVEFSLSEKDSV